MIEGSDFQASADIARSQTSSGLVDGHLTNGTLRVAKFFNSGFLGQCGQHKIKMGKKGISIQVTLVWFFVPFSIHGLICGCMFSQLLWSPWMSLPQDIQTQLVYINHGGKLEQYCFHTGLLCQQHLRQSSTVLCESMRSSGQQDTATSSRWTSRVFCVI